MATAKSALVMEDRLGPELIKFEKKGAMVEGIFVGVTTRAIEDEQTHREKDVQIVTLAETDADLNLTGKEMEFIQSADMRSKVRAADRGKFLRVRYESDMKTKNGTMKVFDVKVSKNRLVGGVANNSGITDEDIPF